MSHGMKIALLLLVVGLGAAGLTACDKRRDPAAEAPVPTEPVPVSPFDFRGLDATHEEIRFYAATTLAASDDPLFDERLEKTFRQASSSPRALEALEFVKWRRSGDPLPESSQPKQAAPNVLLVSIDTLRADHLGCYGYSRDTSPNLDALAERGVVFENAFSTAPWTLPGHMSIFTSLYPSFHKLESTSRRLAPDVQTLTESIKALGHRTSAFVMTVLLARHWGFGRGFDFYYHHQGVVVAEKQTNTAIDWLDWHLFHQRREQRPDAFFLFVHYFDPHETYSPPEPFLSMYTGGYDGTLAPEDQVTKTFAERDFPTPQDYEYVIGLYDGEIRYTDQEVGRLLRRLDTLELLDDMIVIVTSDHGEEFKDHGSMGHQSTVHREQLQVPLIIVGPGLPAGTRVDSQVSLVDVYPTLAGLLGADLPSHAQGMDLRKLLPDPGKVPPRGSQHERERYAELGPLGETWSPNLHVKSVRTGEYCLIEDFDRGTRSLYDHRKDPSEKVDLYHARRNHPRVRALVRKLREFVRAGRSFSSEAANQPTVELDENTRQQLKALGYLE